MFGMHCFVHYMEPGARRVGATQKVGGGGGGGWGGGESIKIGRCNYPGGRGLFLWKWNCSEMHFGALYTML